MITFRPSRPNSRGGALILVLITGMIATVTGAIVLRFGLTEMRVNDAYHTRLQAQNAAEAQIDYAIAQLQRRLNQSISFRYDALLYDPIVLPESHEVFFDDAIIRLDQSRIDGFVMPPEDSNFVAGNQNAVGQWVYLDPHDIRYRNDPLAGKHVLIREIEILSRATARSAGTGREVTSFSRQILEVRDVPFISHAVFFNMDLDLSLGQSTANFKGDVHTNGVLRVGSGNAQNNTSGELNLMGRVTAAHSLLRATLPDGQARRGNVFFRYKDGDFTTSRRNLFTGTDNNQRGQAHHWLTTGVDNFHDRSVQRWQSFMQTSEHGVKMLNPPGIEEYQEEDFSTPEQELRNSAYALIEPQIPNTDPAAKDQLIREQQLSHQAGLLIRAIANAPPADEEEEKDWVPYNYELVRYARDSNGTPLYLPDGRPMEISLNLTNLDGLITFDRYEEGGDGHPVSGLFDARQQQSYDVMNVNVGALREIIHGERDGAFGGDPNGVFIPDHHWNGVVYIETPFDTAAAASRPDRIVTATGELVVRLENAERLPDPFPETSPIRGMTLATNAPLYIRGHFNADGIKNSNDGSVPGDAYDPAFHSDPGHPEVPAALIADSITLLSNAWDDTRAKLGVANASGTDRAWGQRDAVFTEVSAALITGAGVVDGDSNARPDGALNFIRYLENWHGVDQIFRGSMIALYQSEVQARSRRMMPDRSHPDDFNHFYWPPTRYYGFHEYFQNGLYPPGLPMSRAYFRTSFSYMQDRHYEERLEIWRERLGPLPGDPET